MGEDNAANGKSSLRCYSDKAAVRYDRFCRNLEKKYSLSQAAAFGFFLGVLLVSCQWYLSVPSRPPRKPETEAPTYMLYADNPDSGYLNHVKFVLARLGFKRVCNDSSFDLLWSHEYPYGEKAPFSKSFLQNLKPFQKINHFPGCGYITNKVSLATSGIKYIPKAFELPSEKTELLEYAEQHPDVMFVQKNSGHRGVHIVKVGDIDLDVKETFVQEFVPNPLLVDGHKFDIGVYTFLTSIDPLRVYIYNGDALLRFCNKKYEPFDPEDLDQYVVLDEYVPTWKMPSLRRSFEDLKFGMKDSLNIYLRQQGLDPQKIWDQIEDAIRTVLLAREEKFLCIGSRYNNDQNFFEMVRFDFVVDADLNVFLMEANMSPNLSSEKFFPNQKLYENVLNNLFSVVGVGRRIRADTLMHRSVEEEHMEIPEKALVVYPDECAEVRCKDCRARECRLCRPCLTDRTMKVLKRSYYEHVNRLDSKRVFPPELSPDMDVKNLDLEPYSPENELIILWFLGKCQMDPSWC